MEAARRFDQIHPESHPSRSSDLAFDWSARVAAYERVFAGLLSEPLSQQELADIFGISRNKVRALLKTIDGAEKVPGGWRVPVAKLPPSYHLAAGLLPRSAA